jgi:hypothetical protein
MTKLVLYHDNCPDGFTAAWAAWRRFGDTGEYRPVNYGQPPPVDRAHGRDLYLVDFSYPRAALDQLADSAASVTIFDHHQTAQEALHGWPRGRVVFDMERSGAGITWDELHGGRTTRPKLIGYVEDRDLWRWALPRSRAVSEWLFSIPRTFKDWDEAAWELQRDDEGVAKVGEGFLRLKRERVAKICENVRWLVIGGHRIPVVNTAWDFSEIGEYLTQRFPDAPCGGYYFDRVDRRQWGFRAVGDFDVGALCKAYGGGGHRGAAGFTSAIGWLPESVATEKP